MADKSDFTKPRTNIFKLLPDVFRSENNQSTIENTFNRFLTKDETYHVSGYIGQGNPEAIIKRQIVEPTIERQAFQLQPTAYVKIGNITHDLTYNAWLEELRLMGVDSERQQEWGKTLRFNWVPPVNIDMVINYSNYYWVSSTVTDAPQYLTIENRCTKTKAVVAAYEQLLATNGAEFTIVGIDLINNTFTISGYYTSVFVTNFAFYTRETTDPNVSNVFWDVATSAYDFNNDQTTITVVQPIAIHSPTPPLTTVTGRWWLNTTTQSQFIWNGSAWVSLLSPTVSGLISLTELLNTFQKAVNCACAGDYGFDLGPWDDNQSGSVVWNTALLLSISYPTLPTWIASNGPPVQYSLWYDTTNDVLNQYYDGVWTTVQTNFSVLVAATNGNARWDLTLGCTIQVPNQWTQQNHWVHKTQLSSVTGNIQPAQMPVLEYNSSLELSTWYKNTYAWKYRQETTGTFVANSGEPNRLELEPVKSFIHVGANTSSQHFFLQTPSSNQAANIDFSSIFTPGYDFVVKDDAFAATAVKTLYSVYREVTSLDPSPLVIGTMVTQVFVDTSTTFLTSQLVSGGSTHTRIEPTTTSRGHSFRGYGVHWTLDPTATTTAVASPQADNPLLERAQTLAPSVAVFAPIGQPQFPTGTRRVGSYFVEYDLTIAGAYQFPLPSTLQYNSNNGYMFALANANSVRVYVNNIRQFGSYAETASSVVQLQSNPSDTDYVNSGSMSIPSTSFQYVTAVLFSSPLNQGDVVRIEIGPADLYDMGLEFIAVRTIEDEAAYQSAVIAGTQPQFINLVTYQMQEQLKNTTNQYPLFNVYDVVSGNIVKASSIFAFAESPTDAVNPYIGMRIEVDSTGTDYTFEQQLVDIDNGPIYGYRNLSILHNTYWFEPIGQTLRKWDGRSWEQTQIITTVSDPGNIANLVFVTFPPYVGTTPPSYYLNVNGSLWFDTSREELYQNDNGAWIQLTDIQISTGDPTLQTIWKRESHNYPYVPQKVDWNRRTLTEYNVAEAAYIDTEVLTLQTENPSWTPAQLQAQAQLNWNTSQIKDSRGLSPTGEWLGDWEIPSQWYYNSSHDNKKTITLSDIATHFQTIIAQQPPVPGLVGGGVYSLLQDQFNYGLGGTIHDHNDSYDLMISAVNVNNVTPPGLISFAEDQYENLTKLAVDIFRSNVISILLSGSSSSIVTPGKAFADVIATSLIANDFFGQVYGDTTAYDLQTQRGVPNWIATPAMFGLAPKIIPYVDIDRNLIMSDTGSNLCEVICHDGHRLQVTYSALEETTLARTVCTTIDPRVSNQTYGKIVNLPPGPPSWGSTVPQTATALIAAFGSIRPVLFWYETSPSTSEKRFYRLTLVAISGTAPTDTTLPDGSLWYNTTTSTLMSKVGMVWNAVTSVGDGIIASAWKQTRFQELLAFTLENIEHRLYDVCPDYYQPTFDYSSLTTTVPNQQLYQQLLEEQFSTFVVDHDIVAPFRNTYYSPTNPFTWNYLKSTLNTPPRAGSANSESDWRQIYTQWYNTPYPHLEPWKLQGYINKPTWWNSIYVDGSRPRWNALMWTNVLAGIVPASYPLPNGDPSSGTSNQVTSYNYVAVNIGNVPVGPGNAYNPDDLLPPYFSTTSPTIRSLFTQFSQIVAQDSDFSYGNGTFVEWQWQTSLQYQYDKMVVAFKMQPTEFYHKAFGLQYVTIDGLDVERNFKRVFSHTDTIFHGDTFGTNQYYIAQGLNQWYSNYNRYSGYDTNDEFRGLWTLWAPHLTYLFGGIVDVSTFDIFNTFFDIIPQDYTIQLINSGVINEAWTEGFDISLLNIPPVIFNYNNQSKWTFEVNSLAPVSRMIQYYPVKQFNFAVDIATGVCTLYQYSVVLADAEAFRFLIDGDVTGVFPTGSQLTITKSQYNDGTYTVISSYFSTSDNITRINVQELIAATSNDGLITRTGMTMPWSTGQVVFFTSTQQLPAPLTTGTPYAIYYDVTFNANQFQISETVSDALAGNVITFTTAGQGEFNVGEIISTFNVYGGAGASKDTWYHYALDTTSPVTVGTPFVVTGMQNLINFIDGYSTYTASRGITFNSSDAIDVDPITGRRIDWQFETERFINDAYSLRNARLVVSDKFTTIVNNIAQGQMKFSAAAPGWTSGTSITFATTGTLPTPLLPGVPYYIIRNVIDTTLFQVSLYKDASVASPITFTTGGSGTITVSAYKPTIAYPALEVNPQRNNVWINTPQGVVANIFFGPYPDVNVQQTIFNQYGKVMTPSDVVVFRQDLQTRCALRSHLSSNVATIDTSNPYSYNHIGGAHVFVEGYEHALIFNDYTITGNLIYSPFLGLNTPRFNVDFYESDSYQLRPSLGGYFLDQGNFVRNIEGAVTDLRNLYDTYQQASVTNMSDRAHALINYRAGSQPYLDLLDVNNQSQFIFYRGSIRYKGSVNAVNAFINASQFVDAQVDEYWAWKVAEFGDNRPKVYPMINLFSTDGASEDVRLEFMTTVEPLDDPTVIADQANGFEVITFNNNANRWYYFPEQEQIIGSELFLDGEASAKLQIYASSTPPLSGQETMVDFWYALPGVSSPYAQHTTYAWNGSQWSPVTSSPVNFSGSTYYVKLSTICDDVRIVQRTSLVTGDLRTYNTTLYSQGTGTTNYQLINSEIISLDASAFVGWLLIFSINPAKTKISPSKLIDLQSKVVVSDVPLWHPALGYHYPNGLQNIDLQTNADPAMYTNTNNPNDVSTTPWNQIETGTVWLDTSYVSYMPYYDQSIYPNIKDRLATWGKLAPWASINVYRWVETTVTPQNWSTLVQSQTGTLTTTNQATGTAKTTQFKRTRTPVVVTNATTLIGTSTINVVGNTLNVNDGVLFTGTTFPTYAGGAIQQGVEYYVVATGPSITISSVFGGPVIVFTSNASVDFTMVPSFKPIDWERDILATQRIFPAMLNNLTGGIIPIGSGTFAVDSSKFNNGDSVDLYVNGAVVDQTFTIVGGITTPAINQIVSNKDVIDVVRTPHAITQSEQGFDPNVSDDGTTNTQYQVGYEYTTRQYYDTTGALQTRYYFWIQNETTTDNTRNGALSPYATASGLQTIPMPYMVLQKPLDDPSLAARFGYGITYGIEFSLSNLYGVNSSFIPVYYRQAVLRGASSTIINGDNRYIWKFLRDLTLRDNLNAGPSSVNLKSKHQEWQLFRQNQITQIPQELWNRMIEAIVGYTLADPSIRVPALSYELYDATNGTSTRYGLGENQAFVNGPFALATIKYYLSDVNNNFYPIDVGSFLATYPLDTPSNIAIALQAIYNQFSVQNVNNIWFSVLSDALTTQPKYKELFKTSWVSVHGIRILQVNGLFDE